MNTPKARPGNILLFLVIAGAVILYGLVTKSISSLKKETQTISSDLIAKAVTQAPQVNLADLTSKLDVSRDELSAAYVAKLTEEQVAEFIKTFLQEQQLAGSLKSITVDLEENISHVTVYWLEDQRVEFDVTIKDNNKLEFSNLTISYAGAFSSIAQESIDSMLASLGTEVNKALAQHLDSIVLNKDLLLLKLKSPIN